MDRPWSFGAGVWSVNIPFGECMGEPALVIWCRGVVVSECFLGHWVSAVHLRVHSSGYE